MVPRPLAQIWHTPPAPCLGDGGDLDEELGDGRDLDDEPRGGIPDLVGGDGLGAGAVARAAGGAAPELARARGIRSLVRPRGARLS